MAFNEALTEYLIDGLAALVYHHMLDCDLLLAPGPVFLERLDLRCERSRQFVESAFGAVLLGNIIDVLQLAREGHGLHVNGGHLCRQHRLDLVLRLDTLDHG